MYSLSYCLAPKFFFHLEINNILENSLRNKIMGLAVFLVRKLNLLHFVASKLIFDFVSKHFYALEKEIEKFGSARIHFAGET